MRFLDIAMAMRIVLAGGAAITLSPQALGAQHSPLDSASRWVFVDQNERSVSHLDLHSIVEVEPGIVKAATRVVYSTLQADTVSEPPSYIRKFDVSLYDCKKRRIRFLGLVAYDREGNPVKTINMGSSAGWDEVLPETVGEVKLEIVCARRRSVRQRNR